MTISIAEFLNSLSKSNSDQYLLVCSEVIVYDNASRIVYIPITTHNNANMNPLGDFRTYIGHGLLWSQHVEIKCTSEELKNSLYTKGYEIELIQSTKDYGIYSLASPASA